MELGPEDVSEVSSFQKYIDMYTSILYAHVDFVYHSVHMKIELPLTTLCRH